MKNATRTKGSVKFRLKESSKEEKPIFLDFSYGRGNRLKYALGYSVNPKYWDSERLKIKNVVAVRNHDRINDLMRDLESELLTFVSNCDSNQIPLSNDLLKGHLDKFTHKIVDEPVEEKTPLTFFEHYDNFIDMKEKVLPKGKKSQTLKSYKQTLKHLFEFQRDTGYRIEFSTIDKEFYSEFVEYMNNKEYKPGVNYKLNTIGKHINNLKIYMGFSAEMELHSNYRFKSFKTLSELTTAIYLDLEEQKKMLNLDLSAKLHYELARDVFIIGCEIGQRISDYHDLQKQSIVTHDGERYIRIKQEKTKKEVLCKITPSIEKIINERYEGKLPPKILEQKLNDYIKIIGKMAGIEEEIKLESTQGGKKTVSYTPKYELIMGHTARRSFCTVKYKAGLPVDYIMELSGHTTQKEFMKYIRNPKEERVAQITATKEFQNASISV